MTKKLEVNGKRLIVVSVEERKKRYDEFKKDSKREWFFRQMQTILNCAPPPPIILNNDGTIESFDKLPSPYQEQFDAIKKLSEEYDRSTYPDLFDEHEQPKSETL